MGPSFFIIFINDIGSSLTTHFRLFADDSMIQKSIKLSERERERERDKERERLG